MDCKIQLCKCVKHEIAEDMSLYLYQKQQTAGPLYGAPLGADVVGSHLEACGE